MIIDRQEDIPGQLGSGYDYSGHASSSHVWVKDGKKYRAVVDRYLVDEDLARYMESNGYDGHDARRGCGFLLEGHLVETDGGLLEFLWRNGLGYDIYLKAGA